jgi:hypothetical protein
VKRRYQERREALQSAWEDVAPSLDARWNSWNKNFGHHPFWWDEFFHERDRVTRAYQTAKAVENGLEPEHLTVGAVRDTAQSAARLAMYAHHRVGGGRAGSISRFEVLATMRIREKAKIIGKSWRSETC